MSFLAQFSVSAHCQLLGVGLCGTIGLINVSLEIIQVSSPRPWPNFSLAFDRHMRKPTSQACLQS